MAKLRRGIGFVFRIVDGDSFYVCINGECLNIRLEGINAPETNHRVEMPGHYGEEAKAELSRLILGRFVWLEINPDPDPFNRMVAIAYLENGSMLNDLLVRRGYACEMGDRGYSRYRKQLLVAEREAREKRRGMWRFRIDGVYP